MIGSCAAPQIVVKHLARRHAIIEVCVHPRLAFYDRFFRVHNSYCEAAGKHLVLRHVHATEVGAVSAREHPRDLKTHWNRHCASANIAMSLEHMGGVRAAFIARPRLRRRPRCTS